MIPKVNDDLKQDFELLDQPNKTYALDIETMSIEGFVDDLDAMKQAIYKILNTERYEYLIYSWNYGVELFNLFGEPLPFVYPELERMITEALLQDDRIIRVEDFNFISQRGAVSATFRVITTLGNVDAEKVVRI